MINEDPRDDNVASGISADLVLPNATASSAKAALADYIENNSERDLIEAAVIKSDDATTYVCNVRYFADERTAQIFRGETFDSYPEAEWNCPILSESMREVFRRKKLHRALRRSWSA